MFERLVVASKQMTRTVEILESDSISSMKLHRSKFENLNQKRLLQFVHLQVAPKSIVITLTS